MSIVLARVDHRLIHGQVVECWVPALEADRLVVVDDAVAGDELRRQCMEIAAPFGCKLEIYRVAEAAEGCAKLPQDRGRAIVLFSKIEDAHHVVRDGLPLEALNVGIVPAGANREAVTRSVFLSRNDAELLVSLRRQGIAIDFRAVPQETPPSVEEALTRITGP